MTVIPSEIRTGDAVSWIDTGVPDGATAVTAFLRTNAASAATIAGVEVATGWQFSIAAATTTAFALGAWQFQIRATVDGLPETVRTGSFEVLPGFDYVSPVAIDLRSQAEKDLESADAAIRALVGGAQEYWIGTGANGGRKVRRADLAELIKWRDRLKAEVAREKQAENLANGLGDSKKLYVRFVN